ncbi:unnamed protein product [Amoebophrya sp. A25]|nr:unnamed protein product [Amoebophrya sp. A25]|eukprot:GSA25T00019545001.1
MEASIEAESSGHLSEEASCPTRATWPHGNRRWSRLHRRRRRRKRPPGDADNTGIKAAGAAGEDDFVTLSDDGVEDNEEDATCAFFGEDDIYDEVEELEGLEGQGAPFESRIGQHKRLLSKMYFLSSAVVNTTDRTSARTTTSSSVKHRWPSRLKKNMLWARASGHGSLFILLWRWSISVFLTMISTTVAQRGDLDHHLELEQERSRSSAEQLQPVPREVVEDAITGSASRSLQIGVESPSNSSALPQPPLLDAWPPKPVPAAAGVNPWPATQPWLLQVPKYSTIEIAFNDDACWVVSTVSIFNATRRTRELSGFELEDGVGDGVEVEDQQSTSRHNVHVVDHVHVGARTKNDKWRGRRTGARTKNSYIPAKTSEQLEQEQIEKELRRVIEDAELNAIFRRLLEGRAPEDEAGDRNGEGSSDGGQLDSLSQEEREALLQDEDYRRREMDPSVLEVRIDPTSGTSILPELPAVFDAGDEDSRGSSVHGALSEVDRKNREQEQLRPHPNIARLKEKGVLKPFLGESEFELAQSRSGGKCINFREPECEKYKVDLDLDHEGGARPGDEHESSSLFTGDDATTTSTATSLLQSNEKTVLQPGAAMTSAWRRGRAYLTSSRNFQTIRHRSPDFAEGEMLKSWEDQDEEEASKMSEEGGEEQTSSSRRTPISVASTSANAPLVYPFSVALRTTAKPSTVTRKERPYPGILRQLRTKTVEDHDEASRSPRRSRRVLSSKNYSDGSLDIDAGRVSSLSAISVTTSTRRRHLQEDLSATTSTRGRDLVQDPQRRSLAEAYLITAATSPGDGLARCKYLAYQKAAASITYDSTTKICILYQTVDGGMLNNFCQCGGFLGWEPQYAEYVGIERFSWRLARGKKLDGSCLPERCALKDMDPGKRWKFRIRLHCETENPLVASWSPLSGIIRSMNLPPATGDGGFSSASVAGGANVLGDLKLWLRSEMGLATKMEEWAAALQAVQYITLPDGTELAQHSPFFYDLEAVLRAHVFHLRAYALELRVEAAVVGTGLPGGLDLQDVMTLTQDGIMQLVAGGDEPNLSHGYIGMRATFEVFGGINFIDVAQTESMIRSHLHSLIWMRDGLTPLEVELLVPQLELVALTATTTVDPTLRESMLDFQGAFGASASGYTTAADAVGYFLFALGSLLYLLAAFSYYQVFIVNTVIDPQTVLPWQFWLCCCNRVPHNHYLLAKNMRKTRGFWFYWLRYHLAWLACPVIGPALLQMWWTLQIDAFSEEGLMPAPDSKYNYQGMALRWATLLRRKRLRPIFKKDEAGVESVEYQVQPPPKRIKDIVPEAPELPPRGSLLLPFYLLFVLRTYKWRDYLQWVKHYMAFVFFLPWICGESVVVKSDQQKKEMEKEAARKVVQEDTKKLAATMFLESAMMHGGGSKSNKIAPLAIEGGPGAIEDQYSDRGAGGVLAIPDDVRSFASTAKTSSLSAEDLAIIRKAKNAQFGRRWLLFADPKTKRLYWHNRDTKVQVKVDAKYTKNLRLMAPWELEHLREQEDAARLRAEREEEEEDDDDLDDSVSGGGLGGDDDEEDGGQPPTFMTEEGMHNLVFPEDEDVEEEEIQEGGNSSSSSSRSRRPDRRAGLTSNDSSSSSRSRRPDGGASTSDVLLASDVLLGPPPQQMM